MKCKLLSIMLSVCMVLALLPAMSFAEDREPQSGALLTETISNVTGDNSGAENALVKEYEGNSYDLQISVLIISGVKLTEDVIEGKNSVIAASETGQYTVTNQLIGLTSDGAGTACLGQDYTATLSGTGISGNWYLPDSISVSIDGDEIAYAYSSQKSNLIISAG